MFPPATDIAKINAYGLRYFLEKIGSFQIVALHLSFLAPPRQKVIREILTASRMSCLKLKGLESQRAQWLLPL
jgi:hypothetical protein